MLDDDGGFSPFLWYKLGEDSAEYSRVMDKTAGLVKSGFRPHQPDIDTSNAIAEARRLGHELKVANENIRAWMVRNESLETEIAERNAEISRLQAKNQALQNELDVAMSCYRSVSKDSYERAMRIEALEDLVEKLRNGNV